MRGHVRRRGSKWAVVVDVGVGGNGKRKQRWHGGFCTRKDAEKALTEILGRLQSGGLRRTTQGALAAFLRAWLETRKAQLRPSIWHGYRKNIEAHVSPGLGSILVQQLTPQRLNAFYANLLSGGRRNGAGGLSARTVRHIHVVLHRALRDAVRWRDLPNNLADFADASRPTNQEMRT